MKWMTLLAALCMALPQTPGPFRSSVEVIEVAVLVRDEGGRLISDLAQTDFELVDDGAPQAIIGFSRVSMPAGPSPGDRSATPPVPRDVASNEQVRQSRIFVLVLDALHVSPRRTRVVRSAARQFVERHMGPADLAAVFAPGALPGATQDFTNDKARLVAAIEQFAGSKLVSATVERDEEKRRGETILHKYAGCRA